MRKIIMKKNTLTKVLLAVSAIGVLGMTGCSGNSRQTQGSSTPQTQEETGTQGENRTEEESQEQEASQTEDLLAAIQDKGEIVIAMEGTWAPWTYHDEEDQLVGYDVEVGQLIAEKLGVEATFVEGGLFCFCIQPRQNDVLKRFVF